MVPGAPASASGYGRARMRAKGRSEPSAARKVPGVSPLGISRIGAPDEVRPPEVAPIGQLGHVPQRIFVGGEAEFAEEPRKRLRLARRRHRVPCPVRVVDRALLLVVAPRLTHPIGLARDLR